MQEMQLASLQNLSSTPGPVIFLCALGKDTYGYFYELKIGKLSSNCKGILKLQLQIQHTKYGVTISPKKNYLKL